MRLRTWLAISLLSLLALPALAQASASAVVKDCTDDGVLGKRYSQKDYRDALSDLPTDVDEYTDCRDVIRRAQLGGAGGGGSSDGGGAGGGGRTGSTGGGASGAAGLSGSGDAGAGTPGTDPLKAASPQERAAFAKAVEAGAAPVKLDGAPVTPGSLGGATVGGVLDLPAPLLILLALLAAGGTAAAGVGARRLVVGRRTA